MQRSPNPKPGRKRPGGGTPPQTRLPLLGVLAMCRLRAAGVRQHQRAACSDKFRSHLLPALHGPCRHSAEPGASITIWAVL